MPEGLLLLPVRDLRFVLLVETSIIVVNPVWFVDSRHTAEVVALITSALYGLILNTASLPWAAIVAIPHYHQLSIRTFSPSLEQISRYLEATDTTCFPHTVQEELREITTLYLDYHHFEEFQVVQWTTVSLTALEVVPVHTIGINHI